MHWLHQQRAAPRRRSARSGPDPPRARRAGGDALDGAPEQGARVSDRVLPLSLAQPDGVRVREEHRCSSTTRPKISSTCSISTAFSPELAAHSSAFMWERLAENLRLLYVALTRARHRMTLVWGEFRSFSRPRSATRCFIRAEARLPQDERRGALCAVPTPGQPGACWTTAGHRGSVEWHDRGARDRCGQPRQTACRCRLEAQTELNPRSIERPVEPGGRRRAFPSSRHRPKRAHRRCASRRTNAITTSSPAARSWCCPRSAQRPNPAAAFARRFSARRARRQLLSRNVRKRRLRGESRPITRGDHRAEARANTATRSSRGASRCARRCAKCSATPLGSGEARSRSIGSRGTSG